MNNRSLLHWSRISVRAVVVALTLFAVAALAVSAVAAQDTGYFAPHAASTPGKSWQSISNVMLSDDLYATARKTNKQLKLSQFVLPSIPAGSSINGIAVSVEGHTAGLQALVSLSYNGNASFTAARTTSLTATDTTVVLGGPTDTWGRSWTSGDLTNARFGVKLTSTGTSGNIYVDQVLVKVYYTPPATILAMSPVSGFYGGTTAMSATLTSNGNPVANESIDFYVGGTGVDTSGLCTGTFVGSAVTQPGTGTATLASASLAGVGAGNYPDGACAHFNGDAGYQATSITSSLSITGTDTTLVESNATGTYGGTIDLTATLTLTAGGTPMGGETVHFYLLGTELGQSTTNGQGVASLHNVDITGYDVEVGNDLSVEFTGDGVYSPTSSTAQITINPRAITVTAVKDSKAYDSTVNSAASPNISSGTLASGDTSLFVQTFDTAHVGINKVISASGYADDGNSGANYTVTWASVSTGTITKSPLTVTADNKFKALGELDPVFTASYVGLMGADTGAMIDSAPSCTISVPHTAIGTYPINCSGGSDSDYSLSYGASGTLTITLTHINVSVNGAVQGVSYLNQSASARQSYAGINNGAVQVTSTTHTPIVASQRVAYSPDSGLTWTSYSELMGLPSSQLTDSYYFPWYNSVNLSSQISVGNVGTSSTTVTISIGGAVVDSYTLAPNASKRVKYAGLNTGPVYVHSSAGVPIITSERVSYTPDGTNYTGYSELMGLPASQLTDTYYFSYYNSVNLSEQVSVANVGSSPTTVTITIAGTVVDTYTLAPNGSKRVKYPSLNTGPVIVHSSGGVPIITSERISFSPDAGVTYTGYSEMMGLPSARLTDTYAFPWYNSVDHSMQVSAANVGSGSTTVTVSIAGTQVDSYVLAPNTSRRVKYIGVTNGPVVVHSSGGVKVIASERTSYTPDGGVTYPSFSEMLGLPSGLMTDTYLFPWYNSVNLNTEVRFGVP